MSDFLTDKKLTIVIGAYGSGKSEISVNLALAMRRAAPDQKILLADMDIVNPYYRSADAASVLQDNDIRLISPSYAGTNVDAPVLGGEMYVIFDDSSYKGVFDIGGEDMGAVVLGSLSDRLAGFDYRLLMAVNINRPFTSTAEQIAVMSAELSEACGLKIDGYINNANLLEYTTPENVLEGENTVLEASKITGIPLVMTSMSARVAEEAEQAGIEFKAPHILRLERTIFYNY
ncbi:hypothetical protein SAMN02910456_01069 [Ruminococcaceae bacterium YRB3002]|nr:hypothetical protein SAMN02910456_01069 [Ruminococcaceae bacterium YRB3002]